MATSGSSDYSRTALQIIKAALRKLSVLHYGENPSPEETTQALEAFEMMVKSFQRKYHLWTEEEATLFLTADTVQYSIAGARAVSTFVETTTTADASTSDTSITVDSISGIADGDVLGIVTSSTAVHWTTVNGTPSGSTVAFDDALTADVSSGATVYAYTASTDLIVRPLRILSARRFDTSGSIDTPLGMMGREDYFNLPNKTNSGTPTEFYYNPARSTGVLYLWPAPSVITDLIKFTYSRPIEDFDSTANDPEFPQEWIETLVYQLALRLAPNYGKTLDPVFVAVAQQLLEEAEGFDVENTSVYFQPDFM